MSSLFLARLPREIRDQIYNCVLASSTGFVLLVHGNEDCRPEYVRRIPLRIVPFDVETNRPITSDTKESPVKFPLYRTCRQISDECKNLFWAANALRLEDATDLHFITMWDSLKTHLRRTLQHVAMNLDFAALNQFRWTQRAFQCFVEWSRTGSLRKFSLVLGQSASRMNGCGSSFEVALKRISDTRASETGGACRMFLDLLRARGCFDADFAPHVQKKFLIYTSMKSRSPTDMHPWLDVYRPLDPSRFTKELHDAFKGELWTDGMLCYKDGVKFGDAFELIAEDDVLDVVERSV